MLLGALLPATLAAQSRTSRTDVWADASIAHITQYERSRERGSVFGIGAQHARRSLTIAGELSATFARDSAGSRQADAVTEFLLPWWPRLRTALELSATQYGSPGASRDHSHSAGLRESVEWNVSHAHVGVFVAAATAGTSRLDDRKRLPFDAVSTSAGLQVNASVLHGSIEWQRTLADDYLLAEATGFGLRRDASSYDYRDLVANAALRWRRAELSATHVRRRAGSATTGRSEGTWGSVSAQLTTRAAVVATVGTRLADVLRGVPRASITSVGMRVGIGPAPLRAARARSAEEGNPRELSMHTDSLGAVVTVRIAAKAGDDVQFASSVGDSSVGDSSVGEWTPVAMQRDGAGFSVRVRMPSGTHRIAVRVNGGPWRAPTGTVRVRDDFGGSAGLVVVP